MPKTKNITTTKSTTLTDASWTHGFALADEARQELHKQVAALIDLASGVAASGAKLARSLNERFNSIAKQALVTSDEAGRTLVDSTQKSARDVADRASATVSAIVGPSAAA